MKAISRLLADLKAGILAVALAGIWAWPALAQEGSLMSWGSYIGGHSSTTALAVATDSTGNVYVAGITYAYGWTSGGGDTVRDGPSDGHVVKLSPSGAHLWSTYLGGTGDESISGICVDGAGNVYVAGSTNSAGWVSRAGGAAYNGGMDGFVVKLSPSGRHVWSTYLGGAGDEYVGGLSVDAAGNVCVAGSTDSSGWAFDGWNMIYGGARDGFLAKLSPAGTPLWVTYLGGTDLDYANSVATDSLGNIYALGSTQSPGWVDGGGDTIHGGGMDGYVVKLSPSGGHVWSTFFGGGADEYGKDVAVDGTGNVYAAGITYSPAWISGGWDTTYGGSGDAYVLMLSPAGEHVWSTYFGGSAEDVAYGIALDGAGNAYVGGSTQSSGWVSDGWDTTHGGTAYYDGFAAKLSSVGAHVWSTYLGGGSSDQVRDVAVDGAGNVCAAGHSGSGGWISGGWDTYHSAGEWDDGFVVNLRQGHFVAAPAIVPTSGSLFQGAMSATLSCATVGATIRYTLDGKEPTAESPGIASGATVALNATATLQAKGFMEGHDASGVAAATYICASAVPGAGTQTDPYQISEVGHLVWMSENAASSSGKFYQLMNDIDAAETADWNDACTDVDVLEGFEPIGTDFPQFMGVFDGQGHAVRNLWVNRPTQEYVGLFGRVSAEGAVRNLRVERVVVTGGMNYVGGLAGCSAGTITACHVTGSVTGRDKYVGGLVGLDTSTVTGCSAEAAVTGGSAVGGLAGGSNGTVSGCYATGTVTGYASVGGLVGEIWSATMADSFATGSASGLWCAGGLVGYMQAGTLTNCYATGAASCVAASVGGLVGYVEQGTLTNCYATGPVVGPMTVGGLVGGSGALAVTRCYWDTESSGQTASAGGTGRTTAQMRQNTTFTNWDFATVWGISEGRSYPYLRWGLPAFALNLMVKGAGDADASPQKERYDAGETVALVATPAPDFEFVRWSGTGIANPSSASTTVTMDIDKTVVAVFRTVRGITSIEELQRIGNDPAYSLDGRYWLTQDIDAAATATWNDAGTDESIREGFAPLGSMMVPFAGDLDGQGHAIRNLTINRAVSDYVGLFGHTSVGSALRNIRLEDVSVIGGNWYVGGLVGCNRYGTVTACGATGTVGGGKAVGGLVGENTGLVSGCTAGCAVTGYNAVGGLVGEMWYGEARECYATGAVTSDQSAGGLAGDNSYSTITDCYATGSVMGSVAGGLAGWNSGSITACYATGSVSGSWLAGGLVAANVGTVSQCYWNTETSEQTASAGGTGQPTVEMQRQATFAGWAFGGVWAIVEDVVYPYLLVSAPSLAFGGALSSAGESVGATTIPVNLSGPSLQAVTVHYATTDGTAVAGRDYTTASGTLTFAPGETSKAITVTITADALDEEDETLTVTLSSPANGVLGTPTVHVLTITDDDAAPTLSVDDVTVMEGDAGTGDARFTLTLSGASGRTVTVDCATADGTAVGGSDFVPLLLMTVSFPPGETSETVTVMVTGDMLDETDEVFWLDLSNAGNATIADDQATATIVDDDAAPVITQGTSVSKVMDEDGSPSGWSAPVLDATDADGDTLTWSRVSGPAHGTATVSGTGPAPTISYTPTANWNGNDSFVVQVSDPYDNADTITVNVTVSAVNDMPSFTKGADETVAEDAGAQTVPAWATAIDDGDPEAVQALTFTVTTDNDGMFAVLPMVNASTGDLTYTPTANANGIAAVTVTLTDDATAGGPAMTTAPQVFAVVVTVTQEHALWDLTGPYETTVETTLGEAPLTLNLLHDTKGRLTGTATLQVGTGKALVPVSLAIRGNATGHGGALMATLALKGSSAANRVNVSLSLRLALDAMARQLVGPVTGSIRIRTATTKVSDITALLLPAAMEGTWTLQFSLVQDSRRITGTARLTLSNGVDYVFTVAGRPAGELAVLDLSGHRSDPAARSIRIRTTISPLEGGWSKFKTFSCNGYGQTVVW